MLAVSRRPAAPRPQREYEIPWWQRVIPVALFIGALFVGISLVDLQKASVFDHGAQAVTSTLTDCWEGRGAGCHAGFTTADGAAERGTLRGHYAVDDEIAIEYAIAKPSLIRKAGEDTRGEVTTEATISAITLALALVLLALMWWPLRATGDFWFRFGRLWSTIA